MKKSRILFLEDSVDLGVVIKQLLEINGFEVEWCVDADSAYSLFLQSHQTFNLLIIDVGLTGLSGFDFVERISKVGYKVPFIFLTARSEKTDRLRGLEYGANDYITKPFDIEELILRIKNIVKWQQTKSDDDGVEDTMISIGDIRYNKDELAIYINEGTIENLTKREAEVLEYLIKYANRIVKKDDILNEFWGGIDYFKGRSLDTYIGRLKKVLHNSKQVNIENRYGVGWTFKVVNENNLVK